MESKETVLIVGDDISLDELEADIEVGEDPKGDNLTDVAENTTGILEKSSLATFENQHAICFLDENCVLEARNSPETVQASNEYVLQNEDQLNLSGAAKCNDDSPLSTSKGQFSKKKGNDTEARSGCQCTSSGKNSKPKHDPDEDFEVKRTNIAVHCDKQVIVTPVETDCYCNGHHEIFMKMRDFMHINSLHHVMKEAWTNKKKKQSSASSSSQASSCVNSVSQKETCDNGKTVTEICGKCQGKIKTVINQSLNTTVHNQEQVLLEDNWSEHFSIIESLPEEILLNIFSYLSPKELCKYVAPVCQRWHALAYEPMLWTCLEINPLWEASSDDIFSILTRVAGVKVLSLRTRMGLTYSEVCNYLQICKHLTHLDLGLCDNIDLNVIYCLIKNCQDLQSLNVEGCSNVDLECVKYLSTLQHLCHLNLSHCRLENDSIVLLAGTLHDIVSFNIDGVSWITDEAIISLCESHKSTLRHLELDGEELSDISIVAVSHCVHLITLSVSFCDLLTDTSLDYLKELKKLRKLRLRKGQEFSEEAMVNFFQNGHLGHVNDLDISECAGIKDSSIIALTKSCGGGLVSLALRWCWYVTDAGLISIVDHCSNLKILDLTGLHKLCGDCLDRVPEDMVHLQFLDLRNCNNINDKLICEMIRSKPDLQVINYYGELFVYGDE